MLLLAGLVACSSGDAPTERPNLLLFISDDHGWPDYGFAGHEFVETPNVDRLASEGIVFPNGYASASICKPSLRTLLTGIPPQVWERARDELAVSRGGLAPGRESQYFDITLPRMLATAGYESFAGGKMFEGSRPDAGFASCRGGRQGPCGPPRFGRDSMEVLFDWLESQRGPWFAWVAPKLPHRPYDPPEDLLRLYADLPLGDEAKRYYANVTRMDLRLGEILDFLSERGIAEETVVIYLADNGWEQRRTGTTPHENKLGEPTGKASIHDRGFRTPVIVRWPGRVPGGTRSDALILFEDVYTTLLALAGVRPPACSQGRDFGAITRGEDASWSRSEVFNQVDWMRPPDHGSGGPRREEGWFLRSGRWAYSHWVARQREELFDLSSDPLGREEIGDAFPAKRAELRERAAALARQLATRRCRLSAGRVAAT